MANPSLANWGRSSWKHEGGWCQQQGASQHSDGHVKHRFPPRTPLPRASGGRGGGEVPREDQLTPAWKRGTGVPSSMVACLHGVGLQYPSSNMFLALRFLGQSYESHMWVRVGLWEVLKSVVCFLAVPQMQILFCCAVPQEGLTVTSSSLDLGGLEEGLIPSSLFSLLCSRLLGLLYALAKMPLFTLWLSFAQSYTKPLFFRHLAICT